MFSNLMQNASNEFGIVAYLADEYVAQLALQRAYRLRTGFAEIDNHQSLVSKSDTLKKGHIDVGRSSVTCVIMRLEVAARSTQRPFFD